MANSESSNPFGSKMYQIGPNKQANINISSEISSSNYKPNLKNNSKTNANKYW